MAPLLRIQHTPPSPLSSWLLRGLLIFFGCLLAWAVFARLDIVAVASGKLVPQSYLRIVQPMEQGVVREILVKEGQQVETGQVLMRMDPRLLEADHRVVGSELNFKLLQLRRIDAEMTGTPILKLADDDNLLFRQVDAQYRARRDAHQDVTDLEKASLLKAQRDLRAAREVESKLQQTVPLHKETADGWADLARQGFAGKLMAQERMRVYLESAQDLKAQSENVAGLQAMILQAEKRLSQASSNYRQQLQKERVDTAAEARRLEEELVKQQHRFGQMELRAPQAGIVKDLATHTVGTVAAPGTILMTLVPVGVPLVAEVWINNDDVGFVKPGQSVRLKLSAFQFQKYGMVQGEVLKVGADATESQGAAAVGVEIGRNRIGQSLSYKTIIELGSQELISGSAKYPLNPGMQVAAEIHLGTRTVLEYLLSPVSRAFHEAARER